MSDQFASGAFQNIPEVGSRTARNLNVWELQTPSSGFIPSPLSTAFAAYADASGEDNDFGGEELHAFVDDDETDQVDPLQQHSLEQQLADAYRQGVTDGQNQALALVQEEDSAALRLADAIEALKPQLSDAICIALLGAIKTLLEKSFGSVEPDDAVLRGHCEALARLVSRDLSAVTLDVHPQDLALIGDASCGLALRRDETLRRGTLRLSHADGWIEQGTQPLLDELQNLVEEMEMSR